MLCITRCASLSLWCEGHMREEHMGWCGAVGWTVDPRDGLAWRHNKLGAHHHCFLALFIVHIPLPPELS